MDPCLQRLQQELNAAAASLSPEQLAWHRPEKWSAAEILEHLYLTYTATSKGFSRVLEGGKPLASPLTWKQRAQALVVIRLGYLPSGREAPRQARPRGTPPEQVRAEIAARIAEMDQIMERCEEKFGAQIKLLDHPVFGACSLKQWRKFHLVHGRHHIKQIQRLREEISRNSN